MLRQQVINLYRRIFKAIKEVPGDDHKIELREWARHDFRTNKYHTDELTIKTLLNYGERCLKELQTSVNLAK